MGMSKDFALVLVLVFLTASCIIEAKPVSGSTSVVENSWVTKASMHQARAYLGVAVVDGKIYAIGGDSGRYMGNAATQWGRTYSVVNTNEEYNPANDSWTFKAPMPTSRAGFAVAVYQNKIYCIGGWYADVVNYVDNYGTPEQNITYYNTAKNEVYDPSSNTWETKAPLPLSSSILVASVVNGKIYVLPVLPVSSPGKLEVYNPESDSWTLETPPPYAVTGFTTAVVGNKLYFEGGLMNSSMKSSIQIYDAVADSWDVVSTFPYSFDLYGNGGLTSGALAPSQIYFFMDNVTNVYNLTNNSWALGSSMPTIRYCAGAALVNDTFYIIGGRAGQWGYFVDMRASAVTEQYIPFGYGNIRPTVSVISPVEGTINESSFPLTFTVDKPVSLMEYSLDGHGNISVVGNTTLAGLSNGAHNLTVYAEYSEGSIGASETIAFTVVKPESFPTVTVAVVSVAVAVVVVAGLLVYHKKRKRSLVAV
jgi:N-acetylneuraminic acid mutarotase